MFRFHAVAPIVALLLAVSGLRAAPKDAEGWVDLPAGFLAAGSGRLRIESAGQPVPLEVARDPSWSSDGLHEESAAPGLKLAFRRASDGKSGALTALLLSEEGGPAWNAAVEVSFPGFESALPARFAPRGSDDVSFLGLEGSGMTCAAGLYEASSGRGIDLGGVHESFRFADASSEGVSPRKLRIEGRIPRGKEIALFSWRAIDAVFPRRPVGAASAEAASALLFGWSLPGGSKLVDFAEKRLQAPSISRGAYLEIEDGWQGKSSGKLFGKPDRSWLPSLQLEPAGGGPTLEITSQIEQLRRLDLRPGLWIVPHGQSDETVYRRDPEVFVRDKKGNPIPGGFLGSYVVDGTSRAGITYLIDLFRTLRAGGVTIFRIGGLHDALLFYTQSSASLAVPGKDPVQVLKDTVQAMRDGAGDGAVLAGDWDTPEALAGLLDAARPSLLGMQGLERLHQEGLASARGYFRHRGAWLAECIPLTSWAEATRESERRDLDLSRATFAALTGRGLVIDRSVALPVWGPGLLRGAGSPTPVRPIDLFPSEGLPRVWVLKLPAGGNLMGLFNWSSFAPASIHVAPRDIEPSCEEGSRLVYFDVPRPLYVDVTRAAPATDVDAARTTVEDFAAASAGPHDFFLLPGRSRLLAVHPDLGHPQVVAATGRFLASATSVDDCAWDSTRRELRGRAILPPSDSGHAEMRIHVACDRNDAVLSVEARGGTCQFSVEEGHITLTLGGASAATLPFRVAFASAAKRAPEPARSLEPPRDLHVTFEEGERRPLLEWKSGRAGLEWWRSVTGFVVFRDGKEIARTTDTRFLDAEVVPGDRISYVVAVLPGGARCPQTMFSFPPRKEAFLDDWTPLGFSPDAPPPSRRRSASDGPLSVGGKKFAHGLGMRAPSKVEYRLDGGYAKFEALVGVDDAARFQGSVELVVRVDGVEKLRTPVIHGGGTDPQRVSVPVVGAQVLTLIVGDAGDGVDGDLADWGDAKLLPKN